MPAPCAGFVFVGLLLSFFIFQFGMQKDPVLCSSMVAQIRLGTVWKWENDGRLVGSMDSPGSTTTNSPGSLILKHRILPQHFLVIVFTLRVQ